MTTPTHPVETALRLIAGTDGTECANPRYVAAEALPLARSMVKKLERYDEMVEKAEALEWLIKWNFITDLDITKLPACPAIIKTMLSESGERG